MSAPFQEILVARSLSFIMLWSIWVMVWSARCPLGFTTTTLTSDSDKFDLLINFIQTRGSCLISPFLGLYLFSTKVQRWVARTQMACSLTSSNSHSLNRFIMIHHTYMYNFSILETMKNTCWNPSGDLKLWILFLHLRLRWQRAVTSSARAVHHGNKRLKGIN